MKRNKKAVSAEEHLKVLKAWQKEKEELLNELGIPWDYSEAGKISITLSGRRKGGTPAPLKDNPKQ